MKKIFLLALFILILSGCSLIKTEIKMDKQTAEPAITSDKKQIDTNTTSKNNTDNNESGQYSCQSDDECIKLIGDNCKQREQELGLGGNPFCVDGQCSCACGERDKNGKYIQGLCE